MNIRDVLRPSIREQAAERKPQKKASSFIPRKNTDRLTLSRQALAYISEQNRLACGQNTETEQNSPYKKLEKEQSKQNKLLTIAARLRRGDKVPPEDEEYLMVHDPSFYLLTMSQRLIKRNPEQWESVLDDDDRKELATIEASSMDSAPKTLGGANPMTVSSADI